MNHMARAESLTRGRDGTGHYSDKSKRIYGNISHLGSIIPVAVGTALASRNRGRKEVTITFIGDGGMSVGESHEGLNMAAVWKLPFVLILENNQYAYSTPVERQFKCEHAAERAIGYGIPGIVVDGTNVLEVYEACKEAVENARKGKGPTLIESVTMRMRGHSESDDFKYVPKKILEEWERKDPLAKFEKTLKQKKVLTAAKKQKLQDQIDADIEKAVASVLDEPLPPAEEAEEGVYAE